MQGATPKLAFQNVKYTNHQYIDLPVPTKEIGNYSRLLNFLNGSIQNKCVDMENVHVLVDESSHSSWTELLGKHGGLQEYELRRD